MVTKKSIIPIEENLYDLSIHDKKQPSEKKEESHVYFGKNKTYFLKQVTATRKGKLTFTVVKTEGKQVSKPRKMFV